MRRGWEQLVQEGVARWYKLTDAAEVEVLSWWLYEDGRAVRGGPFSATVRMDGDERWVTGAYHPAGTLVVREVVDPEATQP